MRKLMICDRVQVHAGALRRDIHDGRRESGKAAAQIAPRRPSSPLQDRTARP